MTGEERRYIAPMNAALDQTLTAVRQPQPDPVRSEGRHDSFATRERADPLYT